MTRNRKSRGGDHMKAYELLFFVAPSIDEETRLAVMKRIDTAITADNGNGRQRRQLGVSVNSLTR